MNKFLQIGLLSLSILGSCQTKKQTQETKTEEIKLESYSKTPLFLKKKSGFENLKIYTILSSEDTIQASNNFVYGSGADGAGLLKNPDGTYSLINNIEGDHSIARITLDKHLKPIKGEYIVNAIATARTSQCSGSMITPEEHGFGPLYLSGGEAGVSSRGVFVTDPNKDVKDASTAKLLTAFGQWSVENAVVIGKDAYPTKTVALIGDDHGDNNTPSGQLGMYVGNRGDLENGKLYGLKVSQSDIKWEVDMKEGIAYPVEFVELEERQYDLLDTEAKNKGVMGFSRVEDIDWRRGNATHNREVYFCATGRKKDALIGKGNIYGRVYKLNLDENDPTKGTITCVLDGDIPDGKAKQFHSVDNITVTENYAYIQEDPNGYFDNEDKNHYASLYQYNLNTGELKTVLDCDQKLATAQGYGNEERIWEITGMLDISETTGLENTFLLITQNHGWNSPKFTDPLANQNPSNHDGSILFVIQGLDR